MFSSFFSIVTGKWGIFAAIAAAITIAGLVGYIKLQKAEAAATEIALKSKNEMLTRDVKERDQQIKDMATSEQLFDQRISEVAIALGDLQNKIGQNSVQKTTEYKYITRPRPAVGVPADTTDMETAANGMNEIFKSMVTESQAKKDVR